MNTRHAAVPSYARLSAPIPGRCGDALRVDPLGRVHYDGGSSSDSPSSDSETESDQKKRQTRSASATAMSKSSTALSGAVAAAEASGGGKYEFTHGLRLSFAPVPFLRPKVLSEGLKYSPLPVANATAVGFFDEAKVVLFGGDENVKAVNDTWIYDVSTKKYYFIDPMAVVSPEMQALRFSRGFSGEKLPPPRCGHCAVPVQHVKQASRLSKAKLGLDEDNTPRSTTVDPLRPKLASPSMSPITGAANTTTALSAFEASLLLAASSRNGAAPAPIQPPSFRYEPCMIVFGGADVSKGTYFNDLWLFDVEAAAWRELRPHGKAPSPRWLHSGVALEMRLFIFGGEGANFQILDDLHMYDHMIGSWRAIRVLDPHPPGRMLHSASVVQHKMFIIGGIGQKSTNGCILKTEETQRKTELSDVWQLDLRALVWRQIAADAKASSPFLVRSDVGQTQEAGQCECPTLPNIDPQAAKVYKSLEGHSAITFDHRILVFGGRLNGKYNRRIFSLDTSNEQWTYLGDTPAGQGDGRTPQARSGASCCIMTEFSPINNLANAITLEELDRANVSLSDDALMQPFLHAAAKKLSRQISFNGVLSVYDCKPLLSRTVCGFIYGGNGYPRNFSDLWRVELRDTWIKDAYEGIFGSRLKRLLRERPTHTKDGRPTRRSGKISLDSAFHTAGIEEDCVDDEYELEEGSSSSDDDDEPDGAAVEAEEPASPFSFGDGTGGRSKRIMRRKIETFVFGSPLPAIRRRSSAASSVVVGKTANAVPARK
jgi:hypothetical protein